MKKLMQFFLLSLTLLPLQSFAIIFGGMDTYGWELDFDKVTPEQKKKFGWFNDELKTNFKKTSNVYSSPGIGEWTFTRKLIVYHEIPGQASFLITELLDESSLEDAKKTFYRAMAGHQEFKEKGCSKTELGVQSCEVWLRNRSISGSFAVFYEWKTSTGRKFLLVVRNKEQRPNREIPEEATRVLISLIQIK